MTPDEYAQRLAQHTARLEQYAHEVARLNEINEARQAREDALRVQVEALKVRADWLTQQLAALKQGVQP